MGPTQSKGDNMKMTKPPINRDRPWEVETVCRNPECQAEFTVTPEDGPFEEETVGGGNSVYTPPRTQIYSFGCGCCGREIKIRVGDFEDAKEAFYVKNRDKEPKTKSLFAKRG